MNNILLLILLVFLSLNVFAFLVMLLDKVRSREKEQDRISEGLMFFLATFFGSIGIYLGMFAFRHKTRTWYFLAGIPMLFLQNCAFLYLLYYFLNSRI